MEMRRKQLAGAGAAMVVAGAMFVATLPAWSQGTSSAMGSGTGNAVLTTKLAAARVATAKYATNLARAKQDGYQIITPMIPNMGVHFMNPSISGFDVTKP